MGAVGLDELHPSATWEYGTAPIRQVLVVDRATAPSQPLPRRCRRMGTSVHPASAARAASCRASNCCRLRDCTVVPSPALMGGRARKLGDFSVRRSARRRRRKKTLRCRILLTAPEARVARKSSVASERACPDARAVQNSVTRARMTSKSFDPAKPSLGARSERPRSHVRR